MNMERRLYKNTDKKMVSGVLAGFADYFNVDVTVIRIAYVIVSLISEGFPGLLLYIVLAIVMPDIKDRDRYENAQNANRKEYRTYEKEKSENTEYSDVQYKENPRPEDITTNYTKSGGTYVPKNNDK